MALPDTSPRRPGESRREYWARMTGNSKYDYKKSEEYAATKKIKKYYEGKEGFTNKRAKIDIGRLEDDFNRVLELAGIKKSRLSEDYSRNIRNLKEDKAADTADLNYYVKTQKTRTGQDQRTALSNEARRYELETQKNNESLLSRNLVYAGLAGGGIRGKEEQQLADTNTINKKEINTQAKRSFEDIARTQFEKSRDIATKYGRAVDEAKINRKRGIQDINWDTNTSLINRNRGIEDIKFNKKQDLWDYKYDRGSAISGIYNDFNQYYTDEKWRPYMFNMIG